MKLRTISIFSIVALGSGLTVLGCGGGGSGGGGVVGAASTTTPGTTTPTASTASITTLRLAGGPIVSGDASIAVRVAEPSGAPQDVALAYSTDAGQTWSVPTLSPGPLLAVATGPAPGAEHLVTWKTGTDIPRTASVLLRATIVGATPVTAGPFVIDNVAASSVVLNRKPYLQAVAGTTALIVWRTETDTDSVVEYGETAGLGLTAGDPTARTKLHEVTLTGLTPGAKYTYRVVSGGLRVTDRQTFGAAPAPSQGDFRFLAFGDSGTGSAEQMKVAALLSAEQADLAIHTGDIIYPFGALGNPIGEYNDKFFKPYEGFLSRMPIYPVIGNHDLIALLGGPYKDSFYLPDNGNSLAKELYFSFEWGDAKFIALETTGLFLVPLGDHMRWLQQEIQTNTRKWLIVYMHVPLFSCGNHGDNAILQQVVGPLFENGKVDLVITGHDHNYERTKPIKKFNQDPAYPGLVHILTGGGGAGTYGINPNSRTQVAVRTHHYMRFHAHGDDLDGEAVDLNGAVIDTFTIKNQ